MISTFSQVTKRSFLCFFFFNDPAPTEISTFPLPDALPISNIARFGESLGEKISWLGGELLPPIVSETRREAVTSALRAELGRGCDVLVVAGTRAMDEDRKSTRLNSSHLVISYAVFCLKKNK